MAICRGPSPVSVDSRAAHHPNRQPERRDSAKARRGSDVFSRGLSVTALALARAREMRLQAKHERDARTSRKDWLNCCLWCCLSSHRRIGKRRANAFGRESYKCITQRRRSKIIFSIEEKIAITFLHCCHSLISHRHSQPPPTTHPHIHTISTSPHHTDLTSAFKKESGSDANNAAARSSSR